jgi:uncharacterized SAM-binding protein YcdF (DUF218 family)
VSTDQKSSRRTDGAFAGAALLMVLCCAVGPAVIGAAAGSVIGGWLGIACAVLVAGLVGLLLFRRNRARLLMSVRALLVALIVVSTIGFVVGTSIERHNSGHESAAHVRAEAKAGPHEETGGETAAQHAAESGGEATTAPGESGGESAATHAAEGSTSQVEQHKELRPLGVDIEAIPFIVLAALGSLALAAGAWGRPRWFALLAVLAAAMVAFAALDVREVFHQSDEARTGLEILAGAIAVLHLAAAAVAVRMAQMARAAAG